MTDDEREHVQDAIACEGVSYAFVHYSAFREIADPEFQRLRAVYLAAHGALLAYVGGEEGGA